MHCSVLVDVHATIAHSLTRAWHSLKPAREVSHMDVGGDDAAGGALNEALWALHGRCVVGSKHYSQRDSQPFRSRAAQGSNYTEIWQLA
jgi:hypothetical protein